MLQQLQSFDNSFDNIVGRFSREHLDFIERQRGKLLILIEVFVFDRREKDWHYNEAFVTRLTPAQDGGLFYCPLGFPRILREDDAAFMAQTHPKIQLISPCVVCPL